MELFKVNAGSWSYPESGLFKTMGVPLFSGFMYASVGSYMARVIRIFDMRFTPYPPFWMTVVLALAIYANFFAHHFGPDMRIGLFAATVLLYGRTHLVQHRPQASVDAFAARGPFQRLPVAGREYRHRHPEPGLRRADGAGSRDLPDGIVNLLLYVSFVTVTLVLRDAASEPKESPATAALSPPSLQ